MLLYLRDLLRGYASLQRFRVKPLGKAACYTGALFFCFCFGGDSGWWWVAVGGGWGVKVGVEGWVGGWEGEL